MVSPIYAQTENAASKGHYRVGVPTKNKGKVMSEIRKVYKTNPSAFRDKFRDKIGKKITNIEESAGPVNVSPEVEPSGHPGINSNSGPSHEYRKYQLKPGARTGEESKGDGGEKSSDLGRALDGIPTSLWAVGGLVSLSSLVYSISVDGESAYRVLYLTGALISAYNLFILSSTRAGASDAQT